VNKTPLKVREQLAGKRILIMGGTGFLGKVWWSMLLHHFPEVEHLYLVVRPRPAKGQDSEQRFWQEIVPNGTLDPLRAKYPGPAFEDFIRTKVTPIPGDVSQPFAGIPAPLRDTLRGKVDVLVNVAGVVDFNPPLDNALKVNAFGMQSLISVCKDLGDIRFMHTSTCYVAGDRTGQIYELPPKKFPFPKAEKLDKKHWDPEREIAESIDMVENVRHRSNDAFRQSHFLKEARQNLIAKNEPARGSALADELAKVKRNYEKKLLIEAGLERAKFWGWHNVYTYTKSIGEQVLADSGLRFTIGRPAVIESAIEYPNPGWNEGINTSAPLIYMAYKGLLGFPARKDCILDVIPVDQVAAGMILSLAELLEGTQKQVYQYGSSEVNPLFMFRLIELVGLGKRRHFQKTGNGGLMDWVQQHYAPVPLSTETYYKWGPRKLGSVAKRASGFLDRVSQELKAMRPVVEPTARALEGFSQVSEGTANVLDQFVPFMATHSYRYVCAHTRAAYGRLESDEKALLKWTPEDIDWREYILEIHIPGIDENVVPLIEEKMRREKKPLRRHDDLVSFIEELAERHENAPALQRTHEDGLTTVRYIDLRDRAKAAAVRLQKQGVKAGDRVLISGANHPDWVVAWFGIQYAGCISVPVEPGLTGSQATNIAGAAGIKAAILDVESRDTFGAALSCIQLDLHELTAPGAFGGLQPANPTGEDLASILFTSGTTGSPKGVMLTHANLLAMIASLAKLFPLKKDDRLLSVLPLHHTFEFSCGLLLPLSCGARIIYLDEITGERLTHGLKVGRVTCMAGVPALWQLLERRIRTQVADRGAVAQAGFDMGLEVNRIVGKATGLDVGRLFFGQVHERLGGNIRLLISGGSALPKETQKLFSGLGLHLAEGYGLTESSPVLTVAKGYPGSKIGHVGRPVPGVQVKIESPNAEGVGEVLARGDNVMKGYYENEAATRSVLNADGWLRTGDLGRMDHKDRLTIVGRAKDVVVTASGENIYLDDVEASLGELKYVKEYCLVGVASPQGGERLGMLVVPDSELELDRVSLHARAKAVVKEAVGKLPVGGRPSIIQYVDADLPKTSTRKVKRKEVQIILERIYAAAAPGQGSARAAGPVRRAIALVAGVDMAAVQSATALVADLSFDSLMWVELGSAIEAGTGTSVDPAALVNCETVADIEALAAEPAPEAKLEHDFRDNVRIPDPLVQPLRTVLRTTQRGLYSSLLDTQVTGRAFIPSNRQTIVVSNHCSHLDMGLVKFALGAYGAKLVGLAAKDYFFEGNSWWVAYFEQLTNLQPIDRKSGFRASFEQAKTVVEAGNLVLIFPEGTRRTDGILGSFKPLVGKLALETGVDVLPLYLDGTFNVLPKGAVLPKGRDLTVRIGAPIPAEKMREFTQGMRASEAARAVTGWIRTAVSALEQGEVHDPASVSRLGKAPAAPKKDFFELLFEELPGRFQPEEVEKPICWYFSLGGEHRWTVQVDAEKCTVAKGRPTGGKADCVIKTSPEIVAKIIRKAYVPEIPEFVSGKIKTNEIPLLMAFSKVFKLGEG
jgi:long-chain acyl-CoA synthetase